jgi:O-antigen ligase
METAAQDERILLVARITLIAYAVVLTIRGTASLQSGLLLTSFALLLWQRRRSFAEFWSEGRWLLGPLLIFSAWVLLVCGFWREPPLRSWDPGSWDMHQPWFSLNQWRRDVVQPMLGLWCGYCLFRESRPRSWLFLVQTVLVVALLVQCLKQFYIGEWIPDTPAIPGVKYWYKGTLFVQGFSRDNIFFSYVLFLLTPGAFWLAANFVRSRKSLGDWRAWCAIFSVLILLYLIFLNKRRGTWLALYVELFLLMLWTGRRQFLIYFFATLLMVLVAAHFRPGWFKRDYDLSEVAYTKGRVQIASSYKSLALEHPWIGVGFGKHTVVKNYWHRIYQHAHNTFANMTLEVGFPGLALWLLALGIYGMRFWRECRSGWTARIGLAFLIGFCVRNCTDDIWIASSAELFWLQIGILLPSRTPADA